MISRPLLHIDTGREWRGGQAQVLNLCQGLHARNIPFLLVTQPASPLAERAKAIGLDVREITMRGEWDIPAARKIA
ncbi:glycosyl transferase, partial [bacterium]|nr:glycosyl transferase [bacterium]